MIKFKYLLIGTSLSFLPTLSFAQCVETTNCETLGYTETSCNGGKGVKCPFGNKWACLGANEEECKQKFCDEYGFTLTCMGTGYAGGAGSACNGKYASCNYASGYEWKDGKCKMSATYSGALGELYYCNGKVVGVKASGMNFYVAMQDLGKKDWGSANDLCSNYNFCANLKGTLPTTGQLQTMYKNQSFLNGLLVTNGGTGLSYERYWSSTVSSDTSHAIVDMSNGRYYDWVSDGYDYYVRPVLVNY